MSEKKSPEMELVKEEAPLVEEVVQEKGKEEPTFSLEEQEMIRRQRAQRQKVLDCKKEVDEALKKYGCTLKVNPNSPIAAPQIMVDIP